LFFDFQFSFWILEYLGGSRFRGNDKLIGVGTGDSSLRWNRNAEAYHFPGKFISMKNSTG
jgi:hypothetical protein